MKKPDLYVIREPDTLAATNVIPIDAASPRERSWRDLVRKLEKNPPAASRPRSKR